MDDSTGVASMNRRRSVHFRGVTRPSHRRGMGVDSDDVLHCTDDVTYHVTLPVQCNGLLKIKVCMEWVSELEALHFNTLHDHYSTALYSLHCTHYTA